MKEKPGSEILGDFLRSCPATKQKIWDELKTKLFGQPSFQELRGIFLVLCEFERMGNLPEDLDKIMIRTMEILKTFKESHFKIKAISILKHQGLNSTSPQTILQIYSTLWDTFSKEKDTLVIKFAGDALIYLWARWLTRILSVNLEIEQYLEEQRKIVTGASLLKKGKIIEKWQKLAKEGNIIKDRSSYSALLAILDFYPQNQINAIRLLEKSNEWEEISFKDLLVQRLKRFKSTNWTQEDREDANLESSLIPTNILHSLLPTENLQVFKDSQPSPELLEYQKKEHKI